MTEPHGGASERPIGRRRGDRIVGAGRATQMAMEQARMAARSDRPVLVHGPDGSGKMHLARAIHSWSARAQGPLVRVSCGGLGEGLLARELFGCAPGSSAQLPEEHIGALARAAGGTLVLARVERLAASVLDALCKALEAGRYERQGDGAGETLRARLVLTAVGLPEGGPLAALVGHEIRLEALRERQEDVLALAAHFLRIAAEEEGVTPVGFTSDARVALLAEPWPGNVRELAERVHQAVRLSGGGAVSAEALLLSADGESVPSFKEAKRAFETRYVIGLLRRCGGNISRAARLAKKDRKDFYDVIRRTGVNPSDFR